MKLFWPCFLVFICFISMQNVNAAELQPTGNVKRVYDLADQIYVQPHGENIKSYVNGDPMTVVAILGLVLHRQLKYAQKNTDPKEQIKPLIVEVQTYIKKLAKWHKYRNPRDGKPMSEKMMVKKFHAAMRGELNNLVWQNFKIDPTSVKMPAIVEQPEPLYVGPGSGVGIFGKPDLEKEEHRTEEDEGFFDNKIETDTEIIQKLASKITNLTEAEREAFRRKRAPIVTQFTAPLRALLRELKNIDQGLAFLKKSGDKPSTELLQLGKRLVFAGRVYNQIQNKQKRTHARFGTFEERNLIDEINVTHSHAAYRLYEHTENFLNLEQESMQVIQNNGRTKEGKSVFQKIDGWDVLDTKPITQKNKSWNPLNFFKPKNRVQEFAKDVIDKKVLEWTDSKGLGILLTPDGKSYITGNVKKQLKKDLAVAIDRKAAEVIGMPLRNIRSVRAAMRLQTRRLVNRTITKMLVNYTGNALIIEFAGRKIVELLRENLWGQLREKFREKGNLEERTKRTLGGIGNLYREYYNLFGPGKNPKTINVDQAAIKLTKRSAALRSAAHYLEKDIENAGRQDLKHKLKDAFSKLDDFVYRSKIVKSQLLDIDADFRKNLEDKFNYTQGIHLQMVILMNALGTLEIDEQCNDKVHAGYCVPKNINEQFSTCETYGKTECEKRQRCRWDCTWKDMEDALDPYYTDCITGEVKKYRWK